MDASELGLSVKKLHGTPARWVDSAVVREEHAGALVWEGEVQVYAPEGHPEADRCYAWQAGTDEGKLCTYTVLRVPPGDSPAAAVRAAIVADHRAGRFA